MSGFEVEVVGIHTPGCTLHIKHPGQNGNRGVDIQIVLTAEERARLAGLLAPASEPVEEPERAQLDKFMREVDEATPSYLAVAAPVPVSEEEPAPAVPDLMANLQRSLDEARAKRKGGR